MFITFEGIEGCGKTTQIKRLSKAFDKFHIQYIMTFEPGGTKIGKMIRKLLLDKENTILSPLTELILYEADRAQHMEEVIKPSLDQGIWVLCDRFTDATVAYQGRARGLDSDLIGRLNREVTLGIMPDITFLIDCPTDVGLKRAITRNKRSNQEGQDRFEREDLEFHNLVREGYLELARKDKDRFVVINGAQNEDDVERDIVKYLSPYMGAVQD